MECETGHVDVPPPPAEIATPLLDLDLSLFIRGSKYGAFEAHVARISHRKHRVSVPRYLREVVQQLGSVRVVVVCKVDNSLDPTGVDIVQRGVSLYESAVRRFERGGSLDGPVAVRDREGREERRDGWVEGGAVFDYEPEDAGGGGRVCEGVSEVEEVWVARQLVVGLRRASLTVSVIL